MSGGKSNTRGTPQGGVASPMLANIYMNRFLKYWRLTGRGEAFRVCCRQRHADCRARDRTRCDRISALQQLATDIGRVVGVASVCREISWPRMKALTDKFSELTKASGANGEEFSSIQQAYDQSTIDSQRTVASKQTDCAAAVRDLADLERAVAPQSPAAVATGASPAQAQAAAVASSPPTPVTTGVALPQYARQRRDR
jgi:hypothetical protein